MRIIKPSFTLQSEKQKQQKVTKLPHNVRTGGVDGGKGWKGDVKNMLLEINKIKANLRLSRH